MINLTDAQARELRAMAQRILQLVPDPDSPVHAREIETGRGLCHREGYHPRLTDEPSEVTCNACRSASDWEPWAFRRSEEQHEGAEP